MTSQTAGQARFTAILVATRQGMKWYASRTVMPRAVRRALDEAMAGPNHDTVVIANEEAREEVTRDLAARGVRLERRASGLDLRLALDLMLFALLGLALWCLATLR